MIESGKLRQKNRTILIVLAILTAAPIALSTMAYYLWKPKGGNSYGELLETKLVPDTSMETLDHHPLSLKQYNGKWLLVIADRASCDNSCQGALHAIHQLRTAQGAEMERVSRLWIVTDGQSPAESTVSAAEGADIGILKGPLNLPGDTAQGIYLLDPLGNQVMRYPRSADYVKVIKELGKILKNNDALG